MEGLMAPLTCANTQCDAAPPVGATTEGWSCDTPADLRRRADRAMDYPPAKDPTCGLIGRVSSYRVCAGSSPRRGTQNMGAARTARQPRSRRRRGRPGETVARLVADPVLGGVTSTGCCC